MEQTSVPSLADPPFAVPAAADDTVTVTLAGEPQGKGRPRAFRRGSFIGHYTPERTRTYEGMIRTAAMEAMGTRPPFNVPLELNMLAVCELLGSWSRKKEAAALRGDFKPAKRPDCDNILKAWLDAFNGVVWRDDVLVVRIVFEKRYGLAPCVAATVRPA